MSTYRAQIGFALDSTLPRDVVTINPHYVGSNPQALADALKVNINAIPGFGTTVPYKIKIYDALKPKPSYPLAEAINGSGSMATAEPRELALCLSFYSEFNRPGLRGRVYIPAAFFSGSAGLRPTVTQQNDVKLWATAFNVNPATAQWAVFSRKMQEANVVTNFWVDDEWDTVRSRGLRPTTRVLGLRLEDGGTQWSDEEEPRAAAPA